ncbi:hypothetical protein O2K51_00850 [Apibacter raozihei]|uniref:hypothetical protein n=1 Tax=Apibacter raozihei TaxID=2500547 RepID=UPI000FE3C8CC|nr:hypothetical protein [Apibacter raozihei]
MKNFVLISSLFILSVSYMCGQVGIGTEFPNVKSILDVESDNLGVLLPRVSKAERDAMDLSSSEKSLLIFNTDSNCYNFWQGDQWLNLCGETPGIEYTMDCATLVLGPTISKLVPNKELDENDYVEVTINVTNPGPLSLTTNIVNGYYFTYSGTITEVGKRSIRLTGEGRPITPKLSSNFKISGAKGCSFTATTDGLSTRTINVLFLGLNDAYTPNSTSASGFSNFSAVLSNPMVFGNDGTNNGIVSGFKNVSMTTISLSTTTNRIQAINALQSGTYDIVITSWGDDGATAANRQDLANAVKVFLTQEKKAALFLLTQDSQVYAKLSNLLVSGSADTVTGLQGSRATPSSVNGAIENIDHPLTNGPFGNLRGLPYTSYDDGLYLNNTVGKVFAKEKNSFIVNNNIVQAVTFTPKDYSDNVIASFSFNFSNNLNDTGGGDTGIFAGPNMFNCSSVSATQCKYENMVQAGQGDQTKINTAFNLNILAYLIGKVL